MDDNRDLATSLARLLGLLGHRSRSFSTAARESRPPRHIDPASCCWTSACPIVDGYQVARTLREEGYHDILIIALSGYGQEEDRQRSREAGMNHHVTKPVDVKTIAELIARSNDDHVASRTARDPTLFVTSKGGATSAAPGWR